MDVLMILWQEVQDCFHEPQSTIEWKSLELETENVVGTKCIYSHFCLSSKRSEALNKVNSRDVKNACFFLILKMSFVFVLFSIFVHTYFISLCPNSFAFSVHWTFCAFSDWVEDILRRLHQEVYGLYMVYSNLKTRQHCPVDSNAWVQMIKYLLFRTVRTRWNAPARQ